MANTYLSSEANHQDTQTAARSSEAIGETIGSIQGTSPASFPGSSTAELLPDSNAAEKRIEEFFSDPCDHCKTRNVKSEHDNSQGNWIHNPHGDKEHTKRITLTFVPSVTEIAVQENTVNWCRNVHATLCSGGSLSDREKLLAQGLLCKIVHLPILANLWDDQPEGNSVDWLTGSAKLDALQKRMTQISNSHLSLLGISDYQVIIPSALSEAQKREYGKKVLDGYVGTEREDKIPHMTIYV